MNMFGARKHLRFEFPELTEQDGSDVLAEWMGTFNERHSSSSREEVFVQHLSLPEAEALLDLLFTCEEVARCHHLDEVRRRN